MNETDRGQPEYPEASSVPAPSCCRWRPWCFRLFIAALVYTLAGFLILPWIARGIATSQLRQQLERDVTISKLRFNPYTFVTEIHGLEILDPDGQLLAAWDRLRVDFQFTSLFYGPWRLREVTLEQPRARVQINPDYTLNFSDLIERFADDQPVEPAEPASLPRLQIDRLQITGVTVDFTDLTPSQPFRRRLGPLTLTVPDFSTLPGHTNTVSLQGATDAGERFTWDAHLWLEPLRLTGQFNLEALDLTQYAALYQDFLQVQLRGGDVEFRLHHELLFDPEHRVARLSDHQFTLANLRLGLPDTTTNLIELDHFTVHAPLLDVWERQINVRDILINGLRVDVRRLPNEQLELVEVAQPPPTADQPPGSALFLFEAFTNVFALFSGSTNAVVATLDDFVLTNALFQLLDEAAPRPAQATVSDLAIRVRDLSNLPDATPAASLSFRWQTNGLVNLKTAAAITPPAANLELDLRDLDLSILDAYLADHLNLSLLDSRFSLSGKGWIETPPDREPAGQFHGQLALESLHTAHATENHDLLKWDAFRIDGIQANLHPLEVAVDRVEFHGPQLWAILNPDGTLNLLTAAHINRPLLNAPGTPAPSAEPPATDPAREPSLAATSTADDAAPTAVNHADDTATAPTSETEPAALPPAHLASFILTNATLNLVDQMANPPVTFVITNFNGELSRLSTTNLQHANFDFQGRIRSGGAFALRGQLRPFDSTDVTTAHLTLNDIELTPGSPYAARFLGYRLDAGKLTTDLHYLIANGQLQATNRIVLDQFTLGARVDSPDALKVPIKLGLAVLQDRQGRINLTVPVSGSLDDPQFNFASVIRGAFANVFTRVLTSPFNVLGSLFGAREDETLQELEFQPGTTNLERRSLSRLQKLEDILYQRPGLQLLVHGAADPQTDNTPALRKTRLFDRLREAARADNAPDPTEPPPPDSPPATQPAAAPADDSPPPPDAATDSIPFTDDDYRNAVQQAYLETVRNLDALPIDNQAPVDHAETVPTPVPAAEPDPQSAVTTPTRRLNRGTPRGGEIMMRHRLRSLGQPRAASPSPAPTPDESSPDDSTTDAIETATATPPSLPPFEQMEQLLLENLTLTHEDLHRLANDRAHSVRHQLLEPARLEPDRILIPELPDPVPRGTKARLELQ